MPQPELLYGVRNFDEVDDSDLPSLCDPPDNRLYSDCDFDYVAPNPIEEKVHSNL
jgi:hypothetical protein